MLFLISAIRAVIELIGLCLLGQGVLYLIGGPDRTQNPVYRLFAVLTAPPRHLVRAMTPSLFPPWTIPALTLMLLFFLWIGLAWIRTMI